MTAQRTLVLLKPDAVQRSLRGEILRRIEAKGYDIVALAQRTATSEELAAHYAEHEGKPFYEGLVEFVTSSPLIAGVVEGERAIEAWRQIAGGTDPVSAATPGTIRGDFALSVGENVVHGSDSVLSAEREIGIWFPELAK